MTKKQATDELLSGLIPPMNQRGFTLSRSIKRFYGYNLEFRPILSFHGVVLAHGTQFRPMVGIRCEAVESIINRVTAVDSKIAKHSATLGTELGMLSNETAHWRAAIATEDQVAPAINLIIKAFDSRALPFYSEFANLAALDRYLNTDPEAGLQLCSSYVYRAMAGVTTRKLLEGNANELIEAYRKRLREMRNGKADGDFEGFLYRIDGDPGFSGQIRKAKHIS